MLLSTWFILYNIKYNLSKLPFQYLLLNIINLQSAIYCILTNKESQYIVSIQDYVYVLKENAMLEIGTKAPEIHLPDQNGKMHTLNDYKGKKVILYFYPKDNTPGCTKQACGFGEFYPQFLEKNAVVLGISKDSVASHKKFEEKYGLPFTLLSDTELEVIKAYDVWHEKNMYGKKTFGVVRTTYLIDEEGFIEKAFNKVKAAENPAQMLGEL